MKEYLFFIFLCGCYKLLFIYLDSELLSNIDTLTINKYNIIENYVINIVHSGIVVYKVTLLILAYNILVNVLAFGLFDIGMISVNVSS